MNLNIVSYIRDIWDITGNAILLHTLGLHRKNERIKSLDLTPAIERRLKTFVYLIVCSLYMHWVFAKILRPRREQIDKREGMGTDWGAVSLC